jgi:hypothetical protein
VHSIELRYELSELKPLENRGFVAAAILLIGSFGVEYAEIFESAVSAAKAQVEAVNDQGVGILRKPVTRYFKSTLFGGFETKVFVGCELRILVRLPELDDVRGAPVALRQTLLLVLSVGEGRLVPDEDLRLYATDAGERRKFVNQVTEQVGISSVSENLID